MINEKTDIFSITPDFELEERKIENIKNRTIDQIFLYLSRGSDYYIQYKNKLMKKSDVSSYIAIAENKVFEKKKKIAFISLGCGDADQEHLILQGLSKEYNIDYYGVDSSTHMLRHAIEKMSDLEHINQKYIGADFATTRFRSYIESETRKYDKRVFCFWRTISNASMTNIVDTFYNIMQEGDLIWIDTKMRSGEDKLSAFKDSEVYQSEYLNKDSDFLRQIFYPLESIGLDIKNGKFKMISNIDDSINATKFHFSFITSQSQIINLGEEKIHISNNEEFKLYKIYNFNKEGLINFFENRDFTCIDYKESNRIGQFLFRKQ